ncbi:MAG: hypothetical protein H0V70_20080 [Ktedonobacteraceae bacterium]|nr:hypothetical protein [Ktedonobacteraceae bacterium]
MKDLEAFKVRVKEYTRQAHRKLDGKLATMEDLAVTIGFTREALSKKLNGKSLLDARDVRNIVRGLARLDAITSRSQAKHLLDLMDVADFEPVDWDGEPLNKLISKSKVDEAVIDALPSEPPVILPLASDPAPIAPKHFQSSISGFPLRRKWLIILFLLLFISSITLYVLPRYRLIISPRDACSIPSSTDTVKDIYTSATCKSKQVMADPLHAQDSYAWDQNDQCFFSGGAYHIIVPKTSFVSECFAQEAPLFSDFALQVDMTIRQGGSGGLLFRAENTDTHDTNAVVYRVPIDDNGSYNFYLGEDLPCNGPPVGKDWCRSSQNAFHRTLGKKNTITVIALGNTIYLYSNGQFVDSARNMFNTTGHIGLFANAYHNTVEVLFSTFKVWTWNSA